MERAKERAKGLIRRQRSGTAPENNLRKFRVYEGLSQPQLAALSDVSVDTISDSENRQRTLEELTQQKLVHGLNANPRKRDPKHQYDVKEVFPNG